MLGSRPYYEAFWTCSKSRQVGMNGPQPITIEAMNAYLDCVREFDVDTRLTYIAYIQALDHVYLEKAYEKLESKK